MIDRMPFYRSFGEKLKEGICFYADWEGKVPRIFNPPCPLVKGESHLLYCRIILMNFDFYEGILSKILYKCLISDLGNSPFLRG